MLIGLITETVHVSWTLNLNQNIADRNLEILLINYDNLAVSRSFTKKSRFARNSVCKKYANDLRTLRADDS